MKYIKLSGNLYLTGNGGINKVEELGEYDPQRKGNNRTLVTGPGIKAVVEETVDQIGVMLGLPVVIPADAATYCPECRSDLAGTGLRQSWCQECLPF